MRIARSLGEVDRDPQSVVTVGTFDGVHLAHQEIVREVVNRAKMKEGRSVVITFEPHPKEVVGSAKGPVKLLTTIRERLALFEGLHVDLVFIVGFTYEFSRLTPSQFYQSYVVDTIGASEVVVGYDHMFGRDRQAGIEELVRMGQKFNFSVSAVHPYTIDGVTVSSTQIRNALAAGDVASAQKFLGYSYSIQGLVVHGDGRGKTIGFPTANITPDSHKKLMPARGVYLVGVGVGQQHRFGMMNIGVRPTVTQGIEETAEVHIFDFAREIYGEHVVITFLKKIRDERKFSSVQELVDQIGRDRDESLQYLAENSKRT